MEKNVFSQGLIVRGHDTKRRIDADARFIVVMTSKDKKIKLSLELPDVGRQIFQLYPLNEIVELSLKEPSQITLDAFKEESETEED